ncbi:MAG: ACT domain-containing protein [Burkholderiaceae bacterium]
MTPAIDDLTVLLCRLSPRLNPGEYVFATVAETTVLPVGAVVASIREAEGLSVVVAADRADFLGLPSGARFAWITLTVHSDLQAVGLTAAFATALGREGISCNVVAGHVHDHIFVPVAQSTAAMAVLHALQSDAQAARDASHLCR